MPHDRVTALHARPLDSAEDVAHLVRALEETLDLLLTLPRHQSRSAALDRLREAVTAHELRHLRRAEAAQANPAREEAAHADA